MNRYKLEIVIAPRAGLLDPQGKAIRQALAALGYDSVEDVRSGKAIFLDVRAPSAEAARDQARAMCRKLLANPVTEEFDIRAAGDATPADASSQGTGGTRTGDDAGDAS